MCRRVMAFFDSASVPTKSVAEMMFSHTYVLNVAFVSLYHINEIRKIAGALMSYTSLFVGREKSVRRGFLCDGRTRLLRFRSRLSLSDLVAQSAY